MSLADIRTEYRRGKLRRADLLPDPIEQFQLWFAEASAAAVIEPTAMVLATAEKNGSPRLRTVLLKGLDARGFVFFTNLESRKARHLSSNPEVSLLFPWLALERQVIVSGRAASVPEADSAAYFASRPRESQIAAWASSQSSPISSRADLEKQWEECGNRFGAGPIPLPPFWGGYRVEPRAIEFWQGCPHRLHDRFEYTRQPDGAWTIQRLSP